MDEKKQFVMDFIEDLDIKEAIVKIDPETKEKSLVIKFKSEEETLADRIGKRIVDRVNKALIDM